MQKPLGLSMGVALVLVAGLSPAATYTWTGGAGDGLWFTAGNWNRDGEPAASAPSATSPDDIVIDGAHAVSYRPGGDLRLSGSLTLLNGAVFRQVDGEAWPNISGTVRIGRGCTFDTGTMGGSNGTGLGYVTVEGGGLLVAKAGMRRGALTVLDGGRVEATGDYGFPPTDDIRAGGVFSTTGTAVLGAGVSVGSAGAVVTTGEFRPEGGSEFANADLTCRLISMSGVCSLLSGSITCSGTQSGGLYQSGSETLFLDFPEGSTCRMTVAGDAATVYSKTFGTSETTPKFRYGGAPISAARFEALFEVSESGGTVTFGPRPDSEGAPRFRTVSLAVGSADGRVSVDAEFERTGTPAATVYLVFGETDRGRNLADWGDSRIRVGTASAAGISGFEADGIPPRRNLVFRLFAVNGEGADVSGGVTLFTRNWGVDGVVNEFVGKGGAALDEAANWRLGHVPDDSEIRWFEDCDGVTASGFVPKATDVFRGGSLAVNGELQPLDGVRFEGTDFTCTRLAPQRSPAAFTAVAGRFTVTSDGNSFWNAGDDARYCDIPEGSTAVFTFPLTRERFVSSCLSKFRFGGSPIPPDDFADPVRWRVTEGEDPEAPSVTFALATPAEGAPKLGPVSVSVAGGETPTTLVASAVLAEAPGGELTGFCVRYGTSRDAIVQKADFDVSGAVVAGEEYAVEISGLSPATRYYYFVEAANAAGTVRSDVGWAVTSFAADGSVYWTGEADARASNADNWYGRKVPSEADVVRLESAYVFGPLEWDLDTPVAGWVQDTDASVLVTFDTTPSQPLRVDGDVILTRANWTHAGPADVPRHALSVSVSGDMTIGADAIVQAGTETANDARFSPRGYRKGPGFASRTDVVHDEAGGTNIETTVYFGAAYAGDGGHRPFDGTFSSYGSILAPADWGSAGKGDNAVGYSGAGLVLLAVGGTLTVDGSIQCHGFGWDAQKSGASGGTVSITAGRLAGTGFIDADGGRCLSGPGSGGRIRVALTGEGATFDGFPAPARIHANPGELTNLTGDSLANDVVLGAAGTVALRLPADAADAATVIVCDANANRREATDPASLVSATHLPARLNPSEDLSASRWRLLEHGKLRLTARAKIAALEITDSGRQRVFLDGHDLSVRKLTVDGRTLKGVYAAAQLNALTGSEAFSGEGTVVCGTPGLVLAVR